MKSLITKKVPRGMYVHIPFCRQKCYYCDFYSLPLSPGETVPKRYTRALRQEIAIKGEDFPDTEIRSIYLGGGTPSLLETSDLKKILSAIRGQFTVRNGCEITLEANPATLTMEKIEGIQEVGFNRVSLGVQSFDDRELKILGRIHDTEQVLATLDLLRAAGCNNFNLDLIYGVPGQTIKTWEKSLKTAVECEPAHISIYLLQLDDGTPMARQIQTGRIQLPEDDLAAEMYEMAMEFLHSKGFNHYEISNFARNGYHCRHNLRYWQAGEYLGIGAGAVSYTGTDRYVNKCELESYLYSLEEGSPQPVEVLESMSARERAIDALILGLRLGRGINLRQFKKRFDLDIYASYHDIIDQYIQAGVLNMASGQLSLTRRGYFLSNQVLCQFMG